VNTTSGSAVGNAQALAAEEAKVGAQNDRTDGAAALRPTLRERRQPLARANPARQALQPRQRLALAPRERSRLLQALFDMCRPARHRFCA
jgi:hypothetical protein